VAQMFNTRMQLCFVAAGLASYRWSCVAGLKWLLAGITHIPASAAGYLVSTSIRSKVLRLCRNELLPSLLIQYRASKARWVLRTQMFIFFLIHLHVYVIEDGSVLVLVSLQFKLLPVTKWKRSGMCNCCTSVIFCTSSPRVGSRCAKN